MVDLPEIPELPPALREQLPLEAQAYIAALEGQLVRLLGRVEALEAHARQHSQNSSRPPSADPPDAPPRRARAKSKRKRGGQPGHKGHHRVLLDECQVNEIVEHWPLACPDCQTLLPAGVATTGPQRQQVWDLPPMQATVTEHRYHSVQCPSCQQAVRAPRPADVPPGAFGPRLTSVVGLLNGRYRLSKREVAAFLADACGVRMSAASVVRSCEHLTQALALPYTELQHATAGSLTANVDETGWKEASQRRWLWVAVAPQHTHFRLAATRAGTELDSLLGAAFGGIVTSDRYRAYLRLPPEKRQLCWAHLARDLTAFSERTGASGAWGKQALAGVAELFDHWQRFREGIFDRATLQTRMAPLQQRWHELLQRGLSLPRWSKIPGFCRDLLAREVALWTFLSVPHVEPTNNAAERALRPAVLWRKGAFGSDSPHGLRFVERFLSVAATCRQQGRHLLTFLTDALTASWAGRPPPQLLPAT